MAKRNPHQLALTFRQQLVALDDKAAAQILNAYRPIASSLEARIADLNVSMAAIAAGIAGDPTPDQRRKMAAAFAQKVRASKLLEQIQTEVKVFSQKMAPEVARQQREALQMGSSHAHRLVMASGQEAGLTAEFDYASTAATEVMVGTMANGTPIADFMSQNLGRDVFERMRSQLLTGIATGRSIAETARALGAALDGNRTRAQTIARTETLRAYREAAREEYLANDDIVEGWVWTAARDGRTCAVCWAMDGRKFANEVPMASHVNCRCVARPFTKTFATLGLADVEETRPEVELGEVAFAKLPEQTQRRILGRGKFEAYKAGDMPLKNVVGYKLSDTWGPSRVERRLADALAGPDQRAFVSTRLRDKAGHVRTPVKAPVLPEPAPEETMPAPEMTTAPAFAFPRDPAALEGLKVVRRLGGTTGAELVEDAVGNRFVRKRGASADHLREEALADGIYRAAGVNVPDFRLYETKAGPVKLAQFIDGELLSSLDPMEQRRVRAELSKNFAVDAFLANQDVAGTGDDNILVDRSGQAWRIDNGSGLRFRAQGARKEGAAAFTEYPTHFFSMRDKQFLAGKTFGDVSFYDAGRQITKLLDARDEILRIARKADPDLARTLEARFVQFEHLEDVAYRFETDRYKVDYADEFARHLISIRADGIVNDLAKLLTQDKNDPTLLYDEARRLFDHLRNPEVIKKLFAYMSKGSEKAPQAHGLWASSQAGSSWDAEPRAWKQVAMNQRNVSEKNYVTSVRTKGSTASGLDHVKQFGFSEGDIRHAMVVQHAFTYHVLSTVALPNNSRETGTMQLIRTESTSAKTSTGRSVRDLLNGEKVEIQRGALESFSAFKWVAVHGSVYTVQEVPHHRILASYMQSKGKGGASYMFAGDGENEFIAMTEGLEIEKTFERRYGVAAPEYKPGAKAAQMAIEKVRWRTENRTGQIPPPAAIPLPAAPAKPKRTRTPKPLAPGAVVLTKFQKNEALKFAKKKAAVVHNLALENGEGGEVAKAKFKATEALFKKAYADATSILDQLKVPAGGDTVNDNAHDQAYNVTKKKMADLLKADITDASTLKEVAKNTYWAAFNLYGGKK